MTTLTNTSAFFRKYTPYVAVLLIVCSLLILIFFRFFAKDDTKNLGLLIKPQINTLPAKTSSFSTNNLKIEKGPNKLDVFINNPGKFTENDNFTILSQETRVFLLFMSQLLSTKHILAKIWGQTHSTSKI